MHYYIIIYRLDDLCKCYQENIAEDVFNLIAKSEFGKNYATSSTIKQHRSEEIDEIFESLQVMSKTLHEKVDERYHTFINNVVKLLSCITLPLGMSTGHLRAGNSNGKKILELLIHAAVMIQKQCILIPESFMCEETGFVFRCHVSTHLSGQPSAVNPSKISRTQGVLTFSCATGDYDCTKALSQLSTDIQKVTPIIVADADTSAASEVSKKIATFFRDLTLYRRNNVHRCIYGLFYSHYEIKVYCLQAFKTEVTYVKEFALTDICGIFKLLSLINRAVHHAAASVVTRDENLVDLFSAACRISKSKMPPGDDDEDNDDSSGDGDGQES